IIASPPRFHVEQVLAALAAGIDVLCEKPLAASCADAQHLAEAEATSGRLLAVGMIRRQMPAARMIRTVLTREVLGAIAGFEVFEGGPFRWPVQGGGYFDARTSGGGVLTDIGAHVLDLLTWWFGPSANVIAADDAMGGIEANARLALELGGVPGVVRLSRDWEQPNHVTIRGAKGVLRWSLEDIDRVTVTLDGDDPLERRAPAGAPATFLDCFRAQLDGVLDAREGTPAAVVRATELLPSIAIIETAYRDRSLLEMPWLSDDERAAAVRARSHGAGS
ncbi:MAG TPA: Gfo/Idh/MocA family oxidoreductase, partial [Candidatus Binatia bacterium]|nr:Gfo/Idh/MocA family oxidoreductase [Candidatus Binatia bacterium]